MLKKANRKTQYQRFGHSVDYFEQQNSLPAFKEVWPEYKELGSQTLQATLKRVDFGDQRFFGKLAKYPRFKAKRRYRRWTYPSSATGWKVHTNMGVNGHLELRDLKLSIPMRGKARTWGRDLNWSLSMGHPCSCQAWPEQAPRVLRTLALAEKTLRVRRQPSR